MPTKAQAYAQMADHAAAQITGSYQDWTAFLTTAARLYKYPYAEQLMIYAQKPEATACAEYDFWNEKMRRYVRRGSKGIALIDTNGDRPRLKYVFDISDTGGRDNSRNVNLWEYRPEHNDAVTTMLERNYEVFGRDGLADQLEKIAAQLADEYWNDNQRDILDIVDDSFLYGYDDFNVGVAFRNAATVSITYSLLSRCGLKPENHFEHEDFLSIFDFNTPAAVSVLGTAVSSINQRVLRQIEVTIRNYEREHITERSITNGEQPDVYSQRGLSDSQYESDRAAGSEPRQVREDAEEISSGEPSAAVESPDFEREAVPTPVGDRAGGAEPAGTYDAGADESTGRDREPERIRPDEMGGSDEQLQGASGGNHSERFSVQLSLFPSENEQISFIDQAESVNQTPFAFSFAQEDIDTVLRLGGNNDNSRQRVAAEFMMRKPVEEIAAFLSREYVGGGGFKLDRGDMAAWFVEDGIHLANGRAARYSKSAQIVTWNAAAQRIGEMLEQGQFATNVELAETNSYIRSQLAQSIWYLRHDFGEPAIEQEFLPCIEPMNSGGYPEITEKLVDALANPEFLSTLTLEYEQFLDAYREDKDLLRFHYHRPSELLDRLHDVALPQREYTAEISEAPQIGRFITEDEINAALSGGSSFEGGKGRIFSYFKELHSLKEQTNFLKNEYGTGGHNNALPGCFHSQEDHSSKGIRIQKPDCYDVQLAWNTIAKRISELIRQGKYLTPEEQEHLAELNRPSEPVTATTFSYADYKTVKDVHADDIVLYQVGEFFEIYGEDAEIAARVLDLNLTSRTLSETKRVPLCGIPSNRLEQYVEQLRDKYDVTISGIEESSQERRIYSLPSIDHEAERATNAYEAEFGADGWRAFPSNAPWQEETHTIPTPHTEITQDDIDTALRAWNGDAASKRRVAEYMADHAREKDTAAWLANEYGGTASDFLHITVTGTALEIELPWTTVQRRLALLIRDNNFLSEQETLPPRYQVVVYHHFENGFDEKLDYQTLAEAEKVAQGYVDGTLEADSFAYDGAAIYDLQDKKYLRIFGDYPDEAAIVSTQPVQESRPAEQNERFTVIETDTGYAVWDDIQNGIHVDKKGVAEDFPSEWQADAYLEEVRQEVSDTMPDNDKDIDEALDDCPITVDIGGELRTFPNAAAAEDALNEVSKFPYAVGDTVYLEDGKPFNRLYDNFSTKYGLLNDRANRLAFADDSSYYLLCSLEVLDDDGNLERKADMFTKRTIKQHTAVTSVDTASEALAVSIGERARVDLPFMAQLTGKREEEIIDELTGVIYHDPIRDNWQTSDEYLSGNVRQKLREAQRAAGRDPAYQINVAALVKAQPKDLDASEIEVRLGATWIDKKYIQQFMEETFNPPFYLRRSIQVNFSAYTAEWNITGKNNVGYGNVAATVTYGTDRANAYRILEDSLNLRDIRIYDTVQDADGKERRVLNAKETTLAAQKQQAIREAFKDWIWRDPHRRSALVEQYNEEMNSTRPREYDGSHITFSGMNPEIQLREHQKNAVAHVLYGGNTLLAHEVGAGKTFEMVAACMESKRLGLSQKSIFVVPNHLTEQWASEFLRLYPSANLLVTTKKDFETRNRKKFCARIATGDYDAVIIGHSQFERIPISPERQERLLQEQIDEITDGIAEVQSSGGERFTIKQLERTRKGLEARLEKLQASDRKDDVVTFEQLGCDRMFVDESDNYKNLFLYTKMRNVAGLSTTDAQKSSDMFSKCRYLDELTGNRGTVFATGTPISNSMTEMYTIQRYLQYDRIKEMGMSHFDCWASRFGETATALELAPEGTGYRARTRFAKFFNLPELMNLFREVADIKTADQLNLPTPEVEYHTIASKPTEHQQAMVKVLSDRAAKVHSGSVDPSTDNMLKITSDGRKLGLDQRIINSMLPDEPGTKVNQCVDNIVQFWRNGDADKLTQLVFCDISTPKAASAPRVAKAVSGNLDSPEIHSLQSAIDLPEPEPDFTVYEDIRQKLIGKGIPAEQVAFIHDANTDVRKKELFGKVRSGQVRVLIGSTAKMGAGTNVQDRLIAMHDLDCPWRPRDLTQRKGRIERQGNQNEKVHVCRYVTEGTFDAYLWQTVENKQKFISQIMSSKSPVRACDDVDETALSFAEIKALCAGDPRIKERMDLDVDVSRLKIMKADHQSKQFRMEDNLLKYFPEQIEQSKGFIAGLEADMQVLAEHPHPADGFSGMEVRGDVLTDKENAGAALLDACKEVTGLEPVPIGTYRGFSMSVTFDAFEKAFSLTLKGRMTHRVDLGKDPRGNLVRIDNVLDKMPERLTAMKSKLENLYQQQEAAQAEVGKPFPQEEELRVKTARLVELDSMLNMDGRDQPALENVIAKSLRPSVLDKLKTPGVSGIQSRKLRKELEER